ncbi:MAG TPA: hypothetical protein VN709_02745 [Terriglobales bacterium]|nr:hypothetical protein [Terriglobales bacterium]
MLQRVRSIFQPGALPAQPASAHSTPHAKVAAVHGVLRHSNGLREFFNGWEKAEDRRVLDLGCTSSANLCYFAERGHNIHSDDLLLEAERPHYQRKLESGTEFDAELWMRENLNFAAQRFDSVLLWDLVDYMPESLVKPLVDRLTYMLKPSGTVLAYFHTRDAGAQAPFFRYHIHDRETVELRPGGSFRLQRIFNNRHVENLFRGYRSVKFFLARDNLREVVATK